MVSYLPVKSLIHFKFCGQYNTGDYFHSFPVGEVAGWVQADFQQRLTSFSSQTAEEAFPRSQIFPVGTEWNLWKKILQEDITLHTSAARGGSHSHGSPHLISIHLLQILAKPFHQHIQCLSQVGKILGPVSPCRHLSISDFKFLGCLLTSVLWWAQQKSLTCSFLVFLFCKSGSDALACSLHH